MGAGEGGAVRGTAAGLKYGQHFSRGPRCLDLSHEALEGRAGTRVGTYR